MSSSALIGAHAVGASLALTLGAVNLRRNPKGDGVHRLIGRVWVVAMYWTVLSSFFVRQLNPGSFSWIHGLSVFTLVTLTVGVVAAWRHRIEVHRGYLRGTYLGTVGAFVGAVVVPQRDIPQLLVHHPYLLSLAAGGVLAATWVVWTFARVLARRSAQVPAH